MLYIVPLALTAMLYRCGLLGMEERTFAMYAVLLIPLSVFDLFVHLKAKGRLLLSGLTAAVLISVSFVVLKFAKDFLTEVHNNGNNERFNKFICSKT